MYAMKNGVFKNRVANFLIAYSGLALSLAFIYNHVQKDNLWLKSGPNDKIYEAVWHQLWNLAICWITFACHQLNSGLQKSTFVVCLICLSQTNETGY
jgi:hypothetical protein